MGFRLPKQLPDIIFKIGVGLLLVGVWSMRSNGFFTQMGLSPYTGLLVSAAGGLLMFISLSVPSGEPIPGPSRVDKGGQAPHIDSLSEIVTDPGLAFRCRGAEYALRKPADQFFASFGAPDWMDDSNAAYSGWNAENLTLEEFSNMYLAYTTAYYYEAGIEVSVDNGGLIKSVTFLPYGTKAGEMTLGGADVRTSLGINRDSRPDDILKVYGRPASRRTDTAPNVLGQMDDNIRYRFGESVLAFNYTNGRMQGMCLFWDPKKVFG